MTQVTGLSSYLRFRLFRQSWTVLIMARFINSEVSVQTNCSSLILGTFIMGSIFQFSFQLLYNISKASAAKCSIKPGVETRGIPQGWCSRLWFWRYWNYQKPSLLPPRSNLWIIDFFTACVGLNHNKISHWYTQILPLLHLAGATEYCKVISHSFPSFQ